jgi:hypothetical protein
MNKQLLSFIILGIVLAFPALAVSADNNIITETISNVTDFIVQITIGLAALAYVAAGLFHMTATGNATKINTARDIALYTTIGLVIILMAKGFISIVETLVAK